MRKVGVHTAQNVAIDFPIASLGQRFLGLAVDLVVMAVLMFALLFLLLSINEQFIYFVLLVFFLYTPVSEIMLQGRTLGKILAGTRVVNIRGKAPRMIDIAIRWVFRMVDIWFSLGAIGVIFISTTVRGQRLGGLLSNTMVVTVKSDTDLSLRDILRIADRSQYEPQYPDAYRFSENDMLTVKNVLDRAERYHNKAHLDMLHEAAERCAAVLGLPQAPQDKRTFLRTLIKDYIVVTRS